MGEEVLVGYPFSPIFTMKKYPVLGVILPEKVKKELRKRSTKNGRSMSTEAARIIAKELGMESAE